jgi:hypothetical protein
MWSVLFRSRTKLNRAISFIFGSLIRKKGVLELPEIFNKLVINKPLVRLLLAGRDVIDIKTGRSTKELMLEKFSPFAATKVEWLDNLPYEKILDQIAKALVTSDIGWAKEVMTDGETGFTIDPKDHQLYAERICQLLMDPALAKKMGTAARERVVERFSTEVVVKRNIEFYEGVVNRE